MSFLSFELRPVTNATELRKYHRLISALLLMGVAWGGLACRVEEDPAPTAADFEPRRVISLLPALTEMTYALGEESRLVGVSHYCKYPEAAMEKPRVGALINADYEHILSLQPDCILLRPEQRENIIRLESHGIRLIPFETDSVQDIRQTLLELGDWYGRTERAREVLLQIDEDLATARGMTRDAFGSPPETKAESWRPSVLFVVGRNPGTLQQIYAAGTGSFVDQLIESAGGTNVLEGTAIPWPVIGKEAILALDPDLIVDGSFLAEDESSSESDFLLPWQQLSVSRAVREGRVIALHDPHMLIPGPSVGKAAMRLAEIMLRAFPERSWDDGARPATSAPSGMPNE